MIPAGAHSLPAARTKYQRYSISAMLPSFAQAPGVWSLALLIQVGSKKWLCYSPLHFSFAGSTLGRSLWPKLVHCTVYPAARTRFHRYSLRSSPFVWVPWVQSFDLRARFSCPGLHVPLSGSPLERSLWPMLVYIGRGKISAPDYSSTCLSSGVWTGLNFRKGLKSGYSHLKLTHLSAAC